MYFYFQDISNSQRVKYSNWMEGHGSKNDNCAFMMTGDKVSKWGSTFSHHSCPRFAFSTF